MSDRLTLFVALYVSTAEAARLFGISARTLQQYRRRGGGPVFRKLGGRVVYAMCDLEAWVDQAACHSTSDPATSPRRLLHREDDKHHAPTAAGREGSDERVSAQPGEGRRQSEVRVAACW